MKEPFEDTGENIYSFMEETLVVCPQCSGCAISRQVDPAEPAGWFAPRRLTCRQCGFTRDWNQREIVRVAHRVCDDYFHLPLWLQTPCCGEVLWVYNERHLAFLEGFVAARLRERVRHEKYGWRNGSLASRLPAWIKSGKNRDELLKGLARVRTRLQEAA